MQSKIQALNNQAAALLKDGQNRLALPLLEEIYQLDPMHKNNLQQLVNIYLMLKEDDKLLKLALAGVQTFPDDAPLHEIIGIYYTNHHQNEQALSYLFKANDLYMGKNSNCLYNLGVTLYRLGDVTSALTSFKQVLTIEPSHIMAYKYIYNEGIEKLKRGDWPHALDYYELRRKKSPDIVGTNIKEQLPHLRQATAAMMGNQINAGDTIFVYPEQGIGDFFQFMRYFKHMEDHGFHILYMERSYSEPSLQQLKAINRILRLCPGISEIIQAGTIPNIVKAYTPLMSLAWLCQTNFQAIKGLGRLPPPVPIKIPQSLIEHWGKWFKEINPNKHKLPMIGIAYRGNMTERAPEGRPIPLDLLLHKLTLMLPNQAGSIFILQKNILPQDQAIIDEFCKRYNNMIVMHPITEDTDFLDVAAMFPSLDFIVTTDTALVHLAGNQGVCPIFMPLMEPIEWRWQFEREDSPWYANLTLIRQENNETWDKVLTRMITKINSSFTP